jgi:uroporphyrinogen-III decarboxylase
MTGRQKIEAAFSRAGAPEIPAVICYEGICVRDHWDQVTSCPWWYVHSNNLEHQLAWRRDAIERTGQDWFFLPATASRQEREQSTIEERPDGFFSVDRRTREAEKLHPPVIGGWGVGCGEGSVKPEDVADTPRKIDAKLPPVEPFDAKAFKASGRADLANRLLAEYGGRVWPFSHVAGPVWGLYNLWGFEEMMIMAASRIDLVKHACERNLERSIRGVRMAAELGAAGIWIEECLTDMLSPKAFAQINVPLLKRLCGEIRSAGMKSIYYYCGNPAGKWDEILSIGADAISLEESKKGFVVDIDEAVERVGGRAVVFGNLNAIDLLPNGTDDDLVAEIKRQIAAGRRNGSRFVMSIGSPVTPATPVSRVRRYCDLVHEIGS